MREIRADIGAAEKTSYQESIDAMRDLIEERSEAIKERLGDFRLDYFNEFPSFRYGVQINSQILSQNIIGVIEAVFSIVHMALSLSYGLTQHPPLSWREFVLRQKQKSENKETEIE